jgi:hypothetical protein
MTPKPITIGRSAQMTKQDAIALAQRTANREGKPMAVLNLNAFSPIYVVRDWDNRFNGQRELVVRVDPVQRAKLSEELAKAMMGARYLAKRAVKDQWLRQKIKISHVDAKELTQAADAYLAEHRAELVEQAKTWLCKS